MDVHQRQICVAAWFFSGLIFLELGCTDASSDSSTSLGIPAAHAAAMPAQRDDKETRRVGLIATAYYEASPAQGRPADGDIALGTKVVVLEDAGSYCLVRWGAKTGWIASDALEPADPPTRGPHKIPMH